MIDSSFIVFGFLVIACLTSSGCDLFSDRQDSKYLGEVIPGTEVEVFGVGTELNAYPDLSPDGTKLLLSEFDDQLFTPILVVLDLTDGRRDTVAQGRVGRWSPTGDRIVYVCSSVHICIVDSGGGVPVMLTPEGRNFFPDWAPDGSGIIFSRSETAEGSPGVWWADPDGSNRAFLFRGAHPVWRPGTDEIVAVRQDAAAEDKLVVFDTSSGVIVDSLLENLGSALSVPRYDSSGKMLVFDNQDGMFLAYHDTRMVNLLVPAPVRAPSGEWEPHSVFTRHAEWVGDGQTIVYEHLLVTQSTLNAHRGGLVTIDGIRSIHAMNIADARSWN